MFISAMVKVFSFGERWNLPFDEAKEWKYIFSPLHKWENIYICFVVVVFLWQLNKSLSAKQNSPCLVDPIHFIITAGNCGLMARQSRHQAV